MITLQINSNIKKKLFIFIYFADILDGYDKFCSTAKKLSSLLYELQRDHLQNFSLSWMLINKRMYQRYVYSVVQDLIPDCILWLKELLDADEYSAMAHRLIRFDEDMSSITQSWLHVWEKLQNYHLTDSDRKRRVMIRNLAHSIKMIHDTTFPFDRYPNLKENITMSQWTKLENREEAWLLMIDYVQREWNGMNRCFRRLWLEIQNEKCESCDTALSSHFM